MKPAVLITGATGQVARGVIPYLKESFDLRLSALDGGGDSGSVQADLLDLASLSSVMHNIDAVLHLAIAPGHTGTFEDDDFNDQRFDVNVKGTYHLFEAAYRAEVKRVVHISSAMVTWGWASKMSTNRQLVAGDAPPYPVGTYALTKTLSEQVAGYYAQQSDMEVITLRITAPLDINAPNLRSEPVRPQQIPFSDLAQAFHKALTVPLSQYEVATIAGDSRRCPWSLEKARLVLGYEPRIHLDELGLNFIDPFAVEDT